MDTTDRLFSPAAERNRQPILDVLQRVLPAHGRALEIASGSGQHVAWFARHLPGWRWQPTDVDAASLPSIAAWSNVDEDDDVSPADLRDGDSPIGADGALVNVLPPLRLDVCDPAWPVTGEFDAITCANMLHIAPWASCAGLMHGAARHLSPSGLLLTYGPYLADDVPTAPGNLAFDADLRRRNPAWGIRRLEDVAAEATRCGLDLRERIPMPANNLMLVFARTDPEPPRRPA